MIDFKPITLADKALVERYVGASECRNCDMAFANMFCWRAVYDSALAEVEGFLIIRFRIDGGHRLGYMQPLGEGDFTPLLPLLAEDARGHGQRLRLVGLTTEGCEQVRRSGFGAFAFSTPRDLSDYIYNAEEISTLPGRRYQAKRNHINRFVAEYDYRYEPLTADRFAECLSLENRWRRQREASAAQSLAAFADLSAQPAGELSTELSAEQQAMREAFDHFEALGLRGGCLYVGDRLVAFTYGSPINHDTFDCHVEKADTAYNGAFTMINRLFAERLSGEFLYINREEDLGLEGLRRAKLSYHPAFLLDKCTAVRMHADEIEVKNLWREAFGDEEAFIDAFIMRFYSRRRAFVARREGRLAGMVHRVPFRTELGRTGYLYGVATAREFRRQGIAAQLIEEAIRRSREEGFDALMLIPADEALRRFYGRFGFSESIPVRFVAARDFDADSSDPSGGNGYGAGEFDFGTGDPAADRVMILPLGNGPAPAVSAVDSCVPAAVPAPVSASAPAPVSASVAVPAPALAAVSCAAAAAVAPAVPSDAAAPAAAVVPASLTARYDG